MVSLLNRQNHSLYKFHWHSKHKVVPKAHFAGQELPLQDEVVHLVHVLTYDLSDKKDVVAKCKDKANSLLCSFKNLSPDILT